MRIPAEALGAALAFALASVVAPAFADEAPLPLAAGSAPQASPSPGLDPGFLLLPAFDLERAASQPAAEGKDAAAGKSADAGPVKVGDELKLRAAGLNVPGVKIAEPQGAEPLEDQGWEISDAAQATAGGGLSLEATPLKPGKATLPSLAILDASGKAVGRTNPFTIDVESAIKKDDPKPDTPADLHPPLSLRFPWWVLAAATLVLAAIVAGAIYGLRRWSARRQPAPAPKPVEPPRPEDEVALAALAELERRGPLKKGEFKAHYFRVSEILKEYVGRRYRFDAVESTTRELIGALEERKHMPDQCLDRLESLFEKLDLVKFTDHTPFPDEAPRIVGDARELVMATRRPPEPVRQEASRAP